MTTTSDTEVRTDHSPWGETSSQAFWRGTAADRERVFAALRDHDPVSWQPPVEGAVAPVPGETGYWAVVRHADVVTVSRDVDRFISSGGVLYDDLPEDYREMTQSFLGMDSPRHETMRRIVAAAFTPKQIGRITEEIETAAREVVDAFASAPSGEVEFVSACAGPLPVRMFSQMFGVPPELEADVVQAADDVVAWADEESPDGRSIGEVQLTAAYRLHEIAQQVVAQRREHPTDDLFTSLAEARVDDEGLSDHEIGSFFVLLSVAATDTTKHTAALALRSLSDHPDQRDWLVEDFDARIDRAVEEFIRHSTAVMTFRRTAAVDTELGGRAIRAGDKVVMFYASGNRDERVFADPERLDLTRDPNPHVGFGGGGRHFCLGNQLAKTSLRALFRQLLTRVPDIHTVGEPDLAGTNFIRGVKRQRAAFTPETS